MGTGRKTTKFSLEKKFEDSWNVSARNLPKAELGAIIFGCKHSTIKECLEKELFGLPAGHYPYVRKATPGLTLFLFNYTDKKLHGIFEAVSHGQMSINPNAWITCVEGAESTPYPAQVRIRAKCRCRPLLEEEMKPIIESNYYTDKFFWFELDKEQTKRLTKLFQSSPWPDNALRPSNANWKKNNFNVPSKSTVIKTADEGSKDVDSEHHFGMAHSNASISNRDAFSPGKKWSQLFKPSSPSPAVNNAEVVKPPEAYHGEANAGWDSHVVECWEDSHLVHNYVKEIFDNNVQYQDETDTSRPNPSNMSFSENAPILDGWGEQNLDYVQAEENTSRPNPPDVSSSKNVPVFDGWGELKLDYLQADETLVDSKENNGSSIPSMLADSGRVGVQLNLIDSSAQEDNIMSEDLLMDMITKFTREIEELKVSQLNRSLKIESLEKEMVHSKQEVVELKKRCQKLECLAKESSSTSCISKWSD